MRSCVGSILEVNLTNGQIVSRKIPDIVYDNVLSGKGLAAWYLMKNIPAGADPLGPENVLAFASGALTGTGALMTGRWTVATKSPLTGGWGDANCGGVFSPAIKQCGYDAIFFSGISEKPVYLYCDNKGAELRDASELWGLDADEAENRLVKDHWNKKKPCVAVIGQAAEKLSLISGICNENGRIAARSGVGAVMGSKRLKAVVLAGTKLMPCADPEAVHQISKEFGRKVIKANLPRFFNGGFLAAFGNLTGALPTVQPVDGMTMLPMLKKWGSPMLSPISLGSGDSPVKNWAGTKKDAKGSMKAYNPDKLIKKEVRKYQCYSCGIGCGGIIDIKDASGGEFPETHKPEYETLNVFGPLLLNNDVDSVLYINELLNKAGMDTISAGNTVAFAIECFEKGILTKEHTGGFSLNWGDMESVIRLVKMMISREGIGDILADGVKRASEVLGGKEYAMHIGGQEPAMHDSRFDPMLAIHYVTEPAPGKHTIGMGNVYYCMSLHEICSWAPPAKIATKSSEIIPSEEMALRSVASACYSMIVDGVGGCYYAEMMGVHGWNPCKYLNAATGWNKTGDEYMEMGKRIQTLRQMFNIKQGVKPSDWKLPLRMAGYPPLKSGPTKNVTLRNDENVKLHWECFGWDGETGEPLQVTIDQLGIPGLLELEEN